MIIKKPSRDLAAALENPDPDAFLTAVRDVAKARGIAHIAEQAGLGRESLYKTLRPGAQPRFDTVRRLIAALRVWLDVVAAAMNYRALRKKGITVRKTIDGNTTKVTQPTTGIGFRLCGD